MHLHPQSAVPAVLTTKHDQKALELFICIFLQNLTNAQACWVFFKLQSMSTSCRTREKGQKPLIHPGNKVPQNLR